MSAPLRDFVGKVGHYFIGNGLSILSGLISYPILTRVLSPSDYGLLGLISSVLLVSVALGKLGVQNSIVRFFSEARRENRLGVLATSYMAFGLFCAGIAASVQGVLAGGLYALGAIESDLAILVAMTAPLVVIRAQHSFGMGFVRAAELTRVYNTVDVLLRYLGLGLALFFVFNLIGGVRGFFTGLLMAESVVLVLALWQTRKLTGMRVGWPDKALMREAVAFGLPLLAFEVTSILLAFGDRVLIKGMLSDEALGHYTAAYNLGDTLQKFLLWPIALAIQPAYMRIWSEEGKAATSAFLSRAGALFFLLVIPAIGGVWAVREPLLGLLAGDDYLSGADVLPLAFGGAAVYAGYTVLGAGLFLEKQTLKMAALVGGACVLNVALNLGLIPVLGIMGAALATVLSYAILIVVMTHVAFRFLRFDIPWAYIARVTVMSAAMVAIVVQIELGHPALTLAARILVGVAVMGALALGLDKEGRALVSEVLRRREG